LGGTPDPFEAGFRDAATPPVVQMDPQKIVAMANT